MPLLSKEDKNQMLTLEDRKKGIIDYTSCVHLSDKNVNGLRTIELDKNDDL